MMVNNNQQVLAQEQVSYGLIQLMTAAEILKDRTSLGVKDHAWARVMLPYQILNMGNGYYLPLNREYKPLGIGKDWFIDYSDCQQYYLTESELDLSQVINSGMYLFDDSTAPWGKGSKLKNYRIKLHALLKLGRPVNSYLGGYRYI